MLELATFILIDGIAILGSLLFAVCLLSHN